jgi:hypothetical protein
MRVGTRRFTRQESAERVYRKPHRLHRSGTAPKQQLMDVGLSIRQSTVLRMPRNFSRMVKNGRHETEAPRNVLVLRKELVPDPDDADPAIV